MATSINFPDAPTIGTQYTYSGVTYEYDGVTWKVSSGGEALYLADHSVTYSKMGYSLKGSSVISGNEIDWTNSGIFTKTITDTITFIFSNLQENKVITIIMSGNFTITWPTYVKIISGDYAGTKINYIQLHCICSVAGSEEVWCVTSQEDTV